MRRSDPQMISDGLAIAAAMCRKFEGLRLAPYRCPAGVPTIGYGSTRYPNGKAVSMDDAPITEDQADDMLMLHLKTQCMPSVLGLVPDVDTPGRLAAMLDFVFNLGAGRFASSSFARKASRGDWDGAKVEVKRWVYSNGKVLPGLKKRREAEAELL